MNFWETGGNESNLLHTSKQEHQARTPRVRITAKMVDVIGSPEFLKSMFGDSEGSSSEDDGENSEDRDFIVDDNVSIESFHSSDFDSTEANAEGLSRAEDDLPIEAACDEVQRGGYSGRIFRGSHLPASACSWATLFLQEEAKFTPDYFDGVRQFQQPKKTLRGAHWDGSLNAFIKDNVPIQSGAPQGPAPSGNQNRILIICFCPIIIMYIHCARVLLGTCDFRLASKTSADRGLDI